MITVGQKLPAFKAPAVVSLEKDKEFQTLSSEGFLGKWLVLFTYPKDFTFVCPTELVEFGKRVKDFADRDAVVVGGSTDNEHSHLAWRKDHEDLRGLPYPLMFFPPTLAQQLGILHPDEGVALRATFIIDPNGVVRFASAYDLSVGRNVGEVLRALDALQTDELCPCNWTKGEKTLGA